MEAAMKVITWLKIPKQIEKKPTTKSELDAFFAKGGVIQKLHPITPEEDLSLSSPRFKHR